MKNADNALEIDRLFRLGCTREQVQLHFGWGKDTVRVSLGRARKHLGRDLPGHGARVSIADSNRSRAAKAECDKAENEAEDVRRRAPRPRAELQRCAFCRLLLSPEGTCIDCPGDPAVRRELFSRRREGGGARIITK